jgi:hypothetical protein
VVSAGGPIAIGAGKLEAGGPGGAIGAGRLAGRLEAGGPGWAIGARRLEAGGPSVRCYLRVVWDGSVGLGLTDLWDRVVAEALGADVLGCDDRMPDRAMEMCPRAVAGLCGFFFRIITAVRVG